jgi:hypothetical protein
MGVLPDPGERHPRELRIGGFRERSAEDLGREHLGIVAMRHRPPGDDARGQSAVGVRCGSE